MPFLYRVGSRFSFVFMEFYFLPVALNWELWATQVIDLSGPVAIDGSTGTPILQFTVVGRQ